VLSAAEADRLQREADSYVQVITAGEEPCQIVWASEAWLSLCEYTSPQVLGHTLEIIQGPLTDRQSVSSLMDAIRKGDPVTLSMINHTRTGKPFSHTLRVEPLRDSRGNVQCFQATSSNIDTSIAHTTGGGAGPSQMASRSASNTMLCGLAELDHTPQILSPTLAPIGEAEGGMGMGGMRRNESNMSISGMLPRTGSELQISEMLDLFEQHGQPSNAPTPKATPQHTPAPHPEGGLQPPEHLLERVLESPLMDIGGVSGDERALASPMPMGGVGVCGEGAVDASLDGGLAPM